MVTTILLSSINKKLRVLLFSCLTKEENNLTKQSVNKQEGYMHKVLKR